MTTNDMGFLIEALKSATTEAVEKLTPAGNEIIRQVQARAVVGMVGASVVIIAVLIALIFLWRWKPRDADMIDPVRIFGSIIGGVIIFISMFTLCIWAMDYFAPVLTLLGK